MTKAENRIIRQAIACFMEDEPNILGGWEEGMDLISDAVMADSRRRKRKNEAKDPA